MTFPSQLDTVLALAEKAEPGPWEIFTRDRWESGVDFFGGPDGSFMFPVDGEPADVAFMEAAVNFLREHGPAIRAAVGGEAVPVAWMLRNKLTGKLWWDEICVWDEASQANEIADDMNDNIVGADFETIALYASPPATVDTVALRELVEKWRREANGGANASSAYVTSTARGYTLAADELAALIAAQGVGK